MPPKFSRMLTAGQGEKAAEGGTRKACGGLPMSAYRLMFLDSVERAIRVMELEAANDDVAIDLICMHALGSNMPVELWQSDRMIIRMTPMTARLSMPDTEVTRA